MTADAADVEALVSYISGGTTNGVLRLTAPATTPAVAPASEGRIYFDGTVFKVSENAGAYVNLVGGGGTLASVLAAGNTTGGTDLVQTNGDEIRGAVDLLLTTTPGLNTGGSFLETAGATGDGATSGSVMVGSGSAPFGATVPASTGGVVIQTGAFTGVTADQGDVTGSILIRVGGGVSLTGQNANGGSVTLSAGSTTNDNSSSGGVTINAGGAAGTNSTGGSVSIFAGSGYTAGGFSITTSTPGPGGGGDIGITAGGGDFFVEATGAVNTITHQCNPGTPTTSTVLDDTYFTVNAILMPSSGIGDNTSNITIETQSGTLGGNGTHLFITPNLGIILEIGNTIKIDPDGTNNWIYGDDSIVAATAGEPLTLRGGQGNTTGAGGQLRLRGGAGGATGAGSSVVIVGGAGGATSGAAGGASITGGAPVDGNGGSVSMTGSAGVGTNRNGGDVTLTPGAPTGTGTAGAVKICGATTQNLSFFGVAAVAQQATPVTLADVIALLQAYGLSA